MVPYRGTATQSRAWTDVTRQADDGARAKVSDLVWPM
jgi:hypothetical protein